MSVCSLYSTMIITARGRRKREIKSLELRNHVLKKERQKKRKTRSSMRVPPPIPVYASGGSDSICLLHSPPGTLHMESHAGPKYKLTPLSKAWVSFPCWWTSPCCRRRHPPLRHPSPGGAQPWPLGQVQPVALPTPCCRPAAPGERPGSFRSSGEAAVGAQAFAASGAPRLPLPLSRSCSNCQQVASNMKGGKDGGDTAG